MRTITLAIAMLLSFTVTARESKVSSHQPKPLSFIENKGQITDQYNKPRKDIDVKLESPGMSVFVGDGAIHYQWYKLNSASVTSPVAPFEGGGKTLKDRDISVETYRMDVELVGANTDAEVVLEERQEYYEIYYQPNHTEGATARTYNRITYKNVYPGIDWVLYSKDNRLKYDFVVHAGADASLIKLQYKGATKLELLDGELIATTPHGSITEDAPYTFSSETGEVLMSSFELEGSIVTFNIVPYAGAFVIDPTLEWATYYGGSASDISEGVCGDRSGNVYIAGVTSSSTNIATAGAFQTSINTTYNGFITKFSINGTRLWGSYFGTSGSPGGVNFHDICSDGTNMYVTGDASGYGLATPGAYQTSPQGLTLEEAILVKFNSSGQRLWSTYYGGTERDDGYVVFADTSGVYFSGHTQSSSGIATPGAFQATYSSPCGFLAKFSHSGTRLWGTYYPGIAQGITGFKDSVVYLAGTAYSAGNFATPGAHQTTFGSGINQQEGFIARFTTGGTRVWGTYYGGSSKDAFTAVATDPAGYLYAVGMTESANNIATPGSFKPTQTNWTEGFLVKFNPAGVRQWGTYTHFGNGMGLDIDTSGRLYYTGEIVNITGFASPNATQTTYGGGTHDACLMIFNNAGWPIWSTYYGGPSSDEPFDLCYTGHRAYITGLAASTTGIATNNAHQTSYGGNSDGFLAQFKPDTYLYLIDPTSLALLCKGDSVKIRYGTTGTYNANNVFTVQLSNAGSFANPTVLGSKTGTQTDSMTVYIPLTLTNGTGYKLRVLASSPADTTYDLGISVTVAPNPPKPIASVNNPVCTGDSIKLGVGTISGVSWSWNGPNSFTANIQNPGIANVTAGDGGDYIVTADLNGCMRKDTVNVLVNATPAKPIAANNGPICAGAMLSLNATSTTPGVSYSWAGPMSFSSTQQNPSINATTPGHAGDYVVTASLANCHAKDTTTAIINSVSSLGAYASPNDTFCNGTLASFVAVPFNGGASPSFQWYKNGVAIFGATGMVYSTSAAVTGDSFYCRMIATGICTDPLELYSPGIKITVLPVTSMPSVTISSNPALPQPGQPVAFTATAINGGPTPTYQWLRNGQMVIGATGANWSAANLHPYDQISCIVFSSDVCANPKTDTSSMIVVNFPNSVKDIVGCMFKVYPNPATNELTIEGEAGMQVSILNVLGQEVYSGVLNSRKELINISQLAPGHYVLQLVGADGVRHVVKVEKQ